MATKYSVENKTDDVLLRDILNKAKVAKRVASEAFMAYKAMSEKARKAAASDIKAAWSERTLYTWNAILKDESGLADRLYAMPKSAAVTQAFLSVPDDHKPAFFALAREALETGKTQDFRKSVTSIKKKVAGEKVAAMPENERREALEAKIADLLRKVAEVKKELAALKQ